ncbi:hypothetical protein EDB85DRAFT_2292174 [Lactarius pseudohatsudake]|nr:hypothetical protein EDB85DRAFT_2292174 [Lactarius pseudohatsudake]
MRPDRSVNRQQNAETGGRAGGTRPPPPCPRLRAKEADRRPNTAPPSAPVDSRTGACRKQRPPPASLVHARTIRTRDKPPPPPLPFARKGGETQERGAARDRARDAGRRGGTRAHRPFPPLTGDRARNARGGAAAPLPWFVRRGDTQTRGARGDESGCAPHTLSAPPPFARTGARSNLEQRPPLPGLARGGNAQKRCPLPCASDTRASEPGARSVPGRPPSPVRALGQRRTGGGAETSPLPQVRAQRRTQTGSHAEAPPSPGFARQGETPRGEPPSRVCALGTRGPGGA